MLLKENKKLKLNLKHILLIVSAFVLAFVTSIFVYSSQVKKVEIDNNGQKIIVKTMAKTVSQVLVENEIELNQNEIVSPQLDYMLGQLNFISITENGSLVTNGKEQENDNQIQALVLKDKETKVEKIEVIENKLPYKVQTKTNNQMRSGESRVVQKGKEGVLEKSYKVVYCDGEEVSRECIDEKVITKPVNKIVEKGTLRTLVTSRGKTIRYKEVIKMSATGYDNGYESTGKNPGHPEYGITYTGIKTRKGIVAVDPKVIPLGTRLYVESLQKGVPNYGEALAADIGGAIKGNKIDLYFETHKEACDWGRRPVRVYILE